MESAKTTKLITPQIFLRLRYVCTVSDEKSAGLKFGEFGKPCSFCQTLFFSITLLILHNLCSGWICQIFFHPIEVYRYENFGIYWYRLYFWQSLPITDHWTDTDFTLIWHLMLEYWFVYICILIKVIYCYTIYTTYKKYLCDLRQHLQL